MSNRFRYWFPGKGETEADGRPFIAANRQTGPREVAQRAVEKHATLAPERWVDCQIEVLSPDGRISAWRVEVEMVPTFRARPA